MTTGSTSVEPKGREKVRALLIDPLQEEGMRRPARETVAQHNKNLTKLAGWLSYMTPENLIEMRRVVRDNAEGKRLDAWPSIVSVRNLAHRMQRPPLDEKHISYTWLASVEGPPARAGGYLVELYEWLKVHGKPPHLGLPKIRDEAYDNRRKRELTEERIGRGTALEEDRVWLEWYLRQLNHCEEIVRRGEEKRAAAAEA